MAEQQPEVFSTKVLINRVEAAIQADHEVRQMAEAVKEAAESQPSTVQNFTKLADTIGLVIQGGNNTISPTFNF